MGYWIWKFGEYEIYHHMMVHSRRQSYGYPEVPVWKVYAPDPVVRFTKEIITDGGKIRIYASGIFSVELKQKDGTMIKYRGQQEIDLPSGNYELSVRVMNTKTFPCIFVEGIIESDKSWMVDDMTEERALADGNELFDLPQKSPESFLFSYEELQIQKTEKTAGGMLFDFGKETFARTQISLPQTEEQIFIGYGESREEALDREWSVTHFYISAEDHPSQQKIVSYPAYAFRYIFVGADGADVKAQYEYLPLEYRGKFQCNDELINRIWKTAAYTFHLNCREFFLDGIKRDRWVWAGDAYQSLFVNHYLFMDADIEKRTLTALGGKSPFRQHINTIMDYTFFWVISCWEYYCAYGDKCFLEQIYPQLCEIISFCRQRTDEDGFIRGKAGDWIFIDWCTMDMEGAVCGEQILYVKALECFCRINHVLGKDAGECEKQAEYLRQRVFQKFYDIEKKAFIDSYESGNRNVTRQNNILAYLFLDCSEKIKEEIYENVIMNDKVEQITTPYFKFYENLVHCESGHDESLELLLTEYYGAMLKDGATTFYEEYDPQKSGKEHYEMYGNLYEKSLCHAWSASPIFLLGSYRLGVKNTGIGYDTFTVAPKLGGMKRMEGRVPLPKGYVDIKADDEKICVYTNATGGSLQYDGQSIELKSGEVIQVGRR